MTQMMTEINSMLNTATAGSQVAQGYDGCNIAIMVLGTVVNDK